MDDHDGRHDKFPVHRELDTSGTVLGMALGGSCKFRTTAFILYMHKYSAVKNLIMKYFCHSHSSRVQPSELVQGGRLRG